MNIGWMLAAMKVMNMPSALPNNLCVIAARGGSKRLPGKNLMLFGGIPLIAHSIQQAKESGVFSKIVVTSDAEDILQTSKQYGAEIIKRPDELATDQAGSLPVILHALQESEKNEKYNSVTLLQVTSPLRLPEDITLAVNGQREYNCGSLVSVRSRELEFNGSIYVWGRDRFVAEQKHTYPDSKYLLMPQSRSVDIDYKDDFIAAEKLYNSGEYKIGQSELI